MDNQKNNNTLALVLAILGLVFGTLGAILFGVYLGIPGILLSIVGLVLAVDTKKKTQNQKGGGAFVVGLLGLIFAAIFTIGCAAVGSEPYNYAERGIIGAACSVVDDIDDISDAEDLDDALDQLSDLLDE